MVITMGYSIFGPSCLLVALLVMTALFRGFHASRRPKGFPPGPPTVPFFGNITEVPRVKAFLQYATIQNPPVP